MDQLIVVGFYAVLAILVITAGKTLFTKKELSHFQYVSSLVLFCSLLYLVLGQVISYILPFVYSTPFDEADGMFDEAFNIFPNICFVLGVFASVTYSLLSVKSKNTNKFFLFLPLLLLVISWLLMLSTIKDESSTTMELVSTGSFFRTMFILNDVATYTVLGIATLVAFAPLVRSKDKCENTSHIDYVLTTTLMGTFVSLLGGFVIYNILFPKTIDIVHDTVRLWDLRTPIILGEIGAIVGLLVGGITTKNKNYKVVLMAAVPICAVAAYLLSL